MGFLSHLDVLDGDFQFFFEVQNGDGLAIREDIGGGSRIQHPDSIDFANACFMRMAENQQVDMRPSPGGSNPLWEVETRAGPMGYSDRKSIQHLDPVHGDFFAAAECIAISNHCKSWET